MEIWKVDLKDETYKFRKDISDGKIATLADNISKYGLNNKVKIRLKPNGKYQIIAGWTRALAVNKLDWPMLPAIIYEDMTDKEAQEVNVLDNVLREDLNDAEKADQVQRLSETHGIEELVKLFGENKQHIYDLLTLAKMEELKRLVAGGKLTLYQAVELNKFPEAKRPSVIERAIAEGWSVNKIKAERKKLKAPQAVNSEEVWDAVVVKRCPEVDRLFEGRWRYLLKNLGVPAPLKCEFTWSIPAREMKPPYVCYNDVEYAVLARARVGNREELKFIKRLQRL